MQTIQAQSRSHCPRRLRPAFTLVEAVLATTILAIIASTATLPFVVGTQHVNEAARVEQAVAYGQALMEEILARPFWAPDKREPLLGPDPGMTSRAEFDSIDDFHGLSESDGVLRDYNNQTINDDTNDGIWREVSVQYVGFPDQADDDADSFVHIQVRVYDGTALLVTLDRIATRED